LIGASGRARLQGLETVATQKPLDIVRRVNGFVIDWAQLYVWGSDKTLERMIADKMSTDMEPVPLFPNIDKYPAESTS